MSDLHVVNFSGGKDSTAMLLMMIERGMRIDRIICVDTTKEFPQMYEHIKRVQAFIHPLQIEIIPIRFDYYFSEHIKTRGKNKGKAGYGWPDFRNRWCTALKREAVRKALPSTGVIQYHGIAADESERLEKNKGRNIRYPLVEWGITERQALDYCHAKGFDWGGLYEEFSRVSCWCCPLSRIGELRTIHSCHKDMWKELQEMDSKSYRRFKTDYTVAELTDKFEGKGKYEKKKKTKRT